jgi:hypothetical protein
VLVLCFRLPCLESYTDYLSFRSTHANNLSFRFSFNIHNNSHNHGDSDGEQCSGGEASHDDDMSEFECGDAYVNDDIDGDDDAGEEDGDGDVDDD